jgi:hypothetical protein
MRLNLSIGAITVVFLSVMAWGQESPGPLNRARARQLPAQQQRPDVPQRPEDFAPDPPPAPVAPTPSPVAAPGPKAASTPAPPPEQLPPATPPQVTYRDGLLTVTATNSSLGSLLSAIRNKAGIQFDGLENGAPERVAIAMGPAPEGEVLAAILGGSSFDYIVLERPDSPGIVQRVVLTPKGGAAAANNPQPAAHTPIAESDDDEDSEEATPQDTPVQPPLAQTPPPQAQPTPQNQQPRTVQQMMEEMKRNAQQQQGQQPPSNAPVKPPQ